jgi:hypothetical protein
MTCKGEREFHGWQPPRAMQARARGLAHEGRSLSIAALGALRLAGVGALWVLFVAPLRGVLIARALVVEAADGKLVAATSREGPHGSAPGCRGRARIDARLAIQTGLGPAARYPYAAAGLGVCPRLRVVRDVSVEHAPELGVWTVRLRSANAERFSF